MSLGQKTILYVFHGKAPEEVRAEKICSSLANAGFKVVFLCRWFGEQHKREEVKGFMISRVGFQYHSLSTIPIPGNPYWTKAIKNHIEEFSPSMIICREMLLMQSCKTAVGNTKIRLILDMAEHYPAAMREWKKYKSNPLLKFLVHSTSWIDTIEKNAVKASDAIITVCEEQIERLHSQYKFKKNRMCIVHNTPESSLFNNVRKGSSVPPVMFGHHGYFTLERNLENLVRGFDIAAKKFPEIQLMLSGQGETYSDVFCAAQQLQSKNRIHFTGPYKADDLNELYSQTDIGIAPYAEQEFRQFTLPNKAFDYMSCGKPIISSGLQPMKRLLDETQAGIYGNCSGPEDIAKLIEKMMQSDVQKMSENGMLSSKAMYTWEHDEKVLIRFISKELDLPENDDVSH